MIPEAEISDKFNSKLSWLFWYMLIYDREKQMVNQPNVILGIHMKTEFSE